VIFTNNSFRILASGVEVSSDCTKTFLNNNDLVIGTTGCGKTRGYVAPLLANACNETLIVTDPKGDLRRRFSGYLSDKGFQIYDIDFADMVNSPDGYNPFDFVSRNPSTGRYVEQDIVTIASEVVTMDNKLQPYFEENARVLMCALIAYVLEQYEEDKQDLKTLADIFGSCVTEQKFRFNREADSGEKLLSDLFKPLEITNPDSTALFFWRMYRKIIGTDNTDKSIQSVLSGKLSSLAYEGPANLFRAKRRINIKDIVTMPSVVFIKTADTKYTMDNIIGLLFTQLLDKLCEYADYNCPDQRLPIPVRLVLDDFGANTKIEAFDRIISVIRSRNIAVSIILQSITQLDSIYGPENARTIINNCDHMLYLGGTDEVTAESISRRTNRSAYSILNMGLKDAYLFERGRAPQKVIRFDISEHPDYRIIYGPEQTQ